MRSITIIGNSVALRVRPPSGRNMNYGLLLKEKMGEGWQVNNLSKTRYLTSEFLYEKDEFIRTYPDVFIINLGCVDAPSREVPKWFSDIFYFRKLNGFYPIAKILYRFIIHFKLRRTFVYLRFKSSWVSLKRFKHNVKFIVTTLQKETNAKLVVIGINKGNERIEASLPGTLKKYKQYNQVLREVCMSADLAFIDVEKLEADEFFPDGVHYNETGHELVASKLKTIISEVCSI